jgi:soluble lytic murein transglycosylase-like protein
MHVESADDSRAVSHASAMGLMQIVPATWRELRARCSLGSDAVSSRDNILTNVSYRREEHDRFGSPASLVAYNARPGRN